MRYEMYRLWVSPTSLNRRYFCKIDSIDREYIPSPIKIKPQTISKCSTQIGRSNGIFINRDTESPLDVRKGSRYPGILEIDHATPLSANETFGARRVMTLYVQRQTEE